jgi:putative DNA primase/helicase
VINAVKAGRTVYIAEGEKDVDSLVALSLDATTNAGGAGKWRPEYSEVLRGANVVIIPDNDAPGREHAGKVKSALDGIAASVRIVSLPGPGKDVTDWIISGGTREELEQLLLGPIGPVAELEPETALEPFRPTDLWNSQLFVHLHGDKVRYCDRMGGWYHYNGKRWSRADGGQIERLAKETVRYVYEMATLEPNDDRRQAIAKHAARSEAAGKLDAMLELARTEEGVIISPGAFDADPFKFNVQNGTLVIDPAGPSITLHPHRPEDLITNISPAEWRGIDAPAPLFEKFLSEAMGGDQEKIDFLRRGAGYTITGDMREQVFFFDHGPEAAGKGTFERAIADVMGTYAQSTEIETFLTSRRETVRNDIAALVGSRLVTAGEPEDGQSFDEGLIKILTGQDKTKARFLFRESFEFSATFKIWLSGNHRPHIRSTGGAMWRRLLIVPFEKTVPEDRRDKLLGEKLKSPEEQAGILAWMARGCLEWLRNGLKPPGKVKAAVAEYRAAEDRIQPFLDDCCENHPAGSVPAAQLYARYKTWADSNGERPISKRAFGMRLSEKGFESGKSGSVRKWLGLVLITGREPGADDE